MKVTLVAEAATRDLLKQVSAERGLADDATIQLGMAALRRQARREQMRRESSSAAVDTVDRDEAEQVLADMESWAGQ